MSYGISKEVSLGFDETVERVRLELQKEGFGVLTEIDVKSTLKNKLDVEFEDYLILGACNPAFAYKALQAEEKIGTMLPCNVVVIDMENGTTEIAAIHPVASMMAIQNPALEPLAQEISEKLQRVINLIK